MCSVKVFFLFGLVTAIVVLADAGRTGHLYIGQLVENIRQFPHHVFIVVPESGQKCGGSILNSRWVLTSAFCVKEGIQLDLYFRKKQESEADDDFFAVSVDRDQVFVYPTNYDDIALVKLPTALGFSESLAPMNISRLPLDALRARYTVMPALSNFVVDTDESTTAGDTTVTTPSSTTLENTTTTTQETTECIACSLPTPQARAPVKDYQTKQNDTLKYGMFNVLENRICKQVYGGAFDEYTQLCIESWGNNPHRPCDSNYGSGLIVGWPAKGELVGLFHMYSPNCENRQPTIFTFIGKYLPWIDSVIRGLN